MSNEDYREKIEEHRQTIEMEEKKSRMSRSNRNKIKKKRKFSLMNALVILLLGIPLLLLIYVSAFYDPGKHEVAEVEKNNDTLVEFQTNNTVSASAKEKEPEVAQEQDAEKEAAEAEAAKKAEAEKQAAEEAAKKAEAEKQAAEEAAKKAEAEKQAAAQKEAEAKKQEAEKQSSGKVHTVQPNENLFRIALKYYNDASGVEKIKQANNLSSNDVYVGQTLIIP
ncbi:LysM peptidoglycan-binding domain-containing protein [Ureibacillus sp. 179-F W5.1 NHS]|uniref:LysM peptidoglycan-binding domain-containing protein n=1 Tax=unclassified Ureibacillus TaxID=2638520 RepID=UPI00311A8107